MGALGTAELDELSTDDAIEVGFTPRSYQREMLEESMKGNVIIAMDTGSGKTNIAVLRIIDELKTTPADKLIWFMAPTVHLCIQQHERVKMEISAVPEPKLLQGNDGVDKWRDKSIWDAALKNVRIVVSPYQILADALSHGFVSMDSISLLVFDEAHNCVGKSAGVRVMRDFYHRRRLDGLPVPHILGLSASPVMKAKTQSPEKLEAILHALCRTPKKSRAELLQYVNIPEFGQIVYTTEPGTMPYPLGRLNELINDYDIFADPWMKQLLEENTERDRRLFEKYASSRKTWCHTQLKKCCRTAGLIFLELGPWALDYYINEIIRRLHDLLSVKAVYSEDRLVYMERLHVYQLLSQTVDPGNENLSPNGVPLISDKVAKFIAALPLNEKFSGITFVQQRATVAVLSQLLSTHPATKSTIRVAGVSSYRGTDITDLFNSSASPLADEDDSDQTETLEKFRRGKLDLLIATTVLEEAVDVPACNLVVCFDEPANLKSFVQRRGRARTMQSRLILMQNKESNRLEEFHRLELEMKRLYADDMRKLKELQEIEDTASYEPRELLIENTGALLSLENAVAHLYHFCAHLPRIAYTDLRPQFVFMDGAPPKVVLPLCVDASVRIAQGRNNLGDKYSEKNAKKDAAFEAGVALYKAGLLNDHLMPLLPKIDMGNELGETLEKPPSMVQAKPLIQPWVQVAQTWLSHSSVDTLRRARLVITEKSGTVISEAEMILPVDIPSVPRFTLHWDDKTEYLVETLPSDISASPTLADVRKAQQETTRILMTAFDWRFPIEPSDSCAPLIPAAWMREAVSLVNLNEPRTLSNLSEGVLIRDKRDHGPPFVFEKYLDYKPGRNMVKSLYGGYDSVGDNVLHLALKQLPRRTDFLHRVGGDVARGQSRQNHTHMSCQYYIDRCVVDGLPFGAVQLGILLPSILHRLEVYMVAQTLSNTILQDLELNDLSLLVTAISASSASEESNYQRFEFFGDSLLKMCVSVQLLAEYPLWHEGYLSQRKDQIVSNTRLCNAALDLGLDRFIITKSFTGRKWRPLYVRDVIQQVEAEPTRKLSSKVLADVVEALFHAAYVDGGVWKALKCMQLFLPEIQWQPLEARRAVLFERGISGVVLPAFLQPLEDLIGYSFQKKSFLIEAMTHASCQSGTASLERLEFLGDAVLDSIIVNELSKHEPELSHVELHRLRTAFVNADFLAFMCMEWSIEQEVGEVLDNEETHTFECTTRKVSSALWRFMLRGSHSLSRLQRQAIKRHEALREAINTSLETGSHYPWALLARLLAPKFNSDIVESLLGAVYVDSGSWDVCTSILERLGILPYARRVLRDAVHTLHPKEELGMLAVDETVNYNVEKDTSEGRGIRVFVCEVLVGERSIATISDGLSIEEAKTRAAEAAVTALKQRDEMS